MSQAMPELPRSASPRPVTRGRKVLVTWRPLPESRELTSLAASLTEAERDRVTDMADPRRRAFVGGRVLARQTLGELLGVPAREVPIELDDDRPLLPAPTGLWFSITHSGPVVACATAHRPVGLDLEQPTGRPPEDSLLRRVCAPREIALVRRAADPESAFLRLWVRKEAVAKAMGLGLDAGFASLQVGSRFPVTAGGTRWRVRDLTIGGLPGAIAASGVAWRLRVRRA